VDLINVMKNEMKITISTIAIGAEADVRIMKRISQYGVALLSNVRSFDFAADRHERAPGSPKEEPEPPRDLTPVQKGARGTCGACRTTTPTSAGIWIPT
jgi:hypothetical protein